MLHPLMNVPLFLYPILYKFLNIIPQIDAMAHSPSCELKDAHINNKLPAPYGTHGAYHVHKSSQLVPIVSQINAVHTLKVICCTLLYFIQNQESHF
jgi:hypothetical protein